MSRAGLEPATTALKVRLSNTYLQLRAAFSYAHGVTMCTHLHGVCKAWGKTRCKTFRFMGATAQTFPFANVSAGGRIKLAWIRPIRSTISRVVLKGPL